MDADEPEINEELTSIVTAVLFGTAVIFGLVGNLLAVLVVSCNANMRSITNILIVSLSVADLLFIIFCVPFTGTQFVLGYWPFGNVWCMAVQYIIAVTAFASVYTLVLMSFHRYLAVVHPVDFLFLRTEKSWIVTILIMWAIIIAYNVRTVWAFGEISFADLMASNDTAESWTSASGNSSSADSLEMIGNFNSTEDDFDYGGDTVCTNVIHGNDFAVFQVSLNVFRENNHK
ncbi:receptor [Nesidiocoris tenuis]|uniref:Receptor n=1 Tax=Nesidiocoris tenuis TaxID=355587 RepID=A0ABN7BEF0_9HEMI|nr:receptor [Nesidiocoris tenuis]